MFVDHNEKRITVLYLYTVILVLMWGVSWPVNKVALNYIDPTMFCFFRVVTALIFFYFYEFIYKKSNLKFDLQCTLQSMTVGFFQVALFLYFINAGLENVDSSIASILAYTTPFFVYPFSVFLFKEYRFLSTKTLGFLIGLFGIAYILKCEGVHRFKFVGLIYLLLASASMSFGIICTKYFKLINDSGRILIIPQLLISLFIIGLLVEDWSINFEISITIIFCILYCGILSTGVGFLMLTWITENSDSYFSSSMIIGVPIVGYISIMFLGDELVLCVLTGFILVIVGFSIIFLKRL